MKILLYSTLLFCLTFSNLSAQEKVFEGEIVFTNSVKTLIKGVSIADWQQYLTTPDSGFVYSSKNYSVIKNSFLTIYNNYAIKSCMVKYSCVDTLYSDFSKYFPPDSAILKKNSKLEYDEVMSRNSITVTPLDTTYLGFKCNKVVLEGYDYTMTQFVLDSNQYENGSSIVVFQKDSNAFYIREAVGVRIIEKKLPIDFFTLPNIPTAKYNIKNVFISSEYKNGQSDWIEYLQNNLKSRLGRKYLTIPDGKDFIKATVIVEFVIDKTGTVVYAKAKNAEFVHSKLAEEAIRVVNKSNSWKPATFYGKPIPYIFKQNITFRLDK